MSGQPLRTNPYTLRSGNFEIEVLPPVLWGVHYPGDPVPGLSAAEVKVIPNVAKTRVPVTQAEVDYFRELVCASIEPALYLVASLWQVLEQGKSEEQAAAEVGRARSTLHPYLQKNLPGVEGRKPERVRLALLLLDWVNLRCANGDAPVSFRSFCAHACAYDRWLVVEVRVYRLRA